MNIATLKQPSTNTADNAIIESALEILATRIREPENYRTSPSDTRAFLQLKLSEIEHEVFAVLFLDTRHGVIAFREIFRGTIDGSSVHSREVVKEA